MPPRACCRPPPLASSHAMLGYCAFLHWECGGNAGTGGYESLHRHQRLRHEDTGAPGQYALQPALLLLPVFSTFHFSSVPPRIIFLDPQAVIKEIPLDRLVVETDAPWCGIKNSHASSSHVKVRRMRDDEFCERGEQTKFEENKKEKFVSGKMVKERNEPAQIVQVLEVIASVKGLEVEEVAAACYQNTINVLFASAT
eukprot:759129-Hanusia_phi.AAC.7